MRARAIAVVLCVVVLPSCKKTVEGETTKWEEHKARVQELTTLYPGFAELLKPQLEQAQQLMDAAKAIGDQEQSLQKMAEANGFLKSGLCHALDRADYRLKQLEGRVRSADTAVRAHKELLTARVTVNSARLALRSAESLLKEGAANATAAMVRLRRVERELNAADSDLDKVTASVREHTKEREKRRAASTKKR